MNINFKFRSKGNATLSWHAAGAGAANTWRKTHTALFFFFLIGAAALGLKIWQQSLYGAGWSDQKKQAYLDAQEKGIVFQEDDFNRAIASVQARKDASKNSFQPSKDIFKPYE